MDFLNDLQKKALRLTLQRPEDLRVHVLSVVKKHKDFNENSGSLTLVEYINSMNDERFLVGVANKIILNLTKDVVESYDFEKMSKEIICFDMLDEGHDFNIALDSMQEFLLEYASDPENQQNAVAVKLKNNNISDFSLN